LERDEIERLLEDAEEGKFNVVLDTKMDRVSRSVYDFLDLDRRLTALDIDIVIATQNIDTTTSSSFQSF
jgi:site-specific DNA recombinase